MVKKKYDDDKMVPPSVEPEVGRWIKWDFSDEKGPRLPMGAKVRVRFRNGRESVGVDNVCWWDWRYSDCSGDIMAYCVVK